MTASCLCISSSRRSDACLVKENVEIGKVEVVEAADGNLLDIYVHKQDGRGVNGVIIEGKAVDQETLHQVAL